MYENNDGDGDKKSQTRKKMSVQGWEGWGYYCILKRAVGFVTYLAPKLKSQWHGVPWSSHRRPAKTKKTIAREILAFCLSRSLAHQKSCVVSFQLAVSKISKSSIVLER